MSNRTFTFHLLPDPSFAPDGHGAGRRRDHRGGVRSSSGIDPLEVPRGPSTLTAGPAGQPRLAPVRDGVASSDACVVEPVFRGTRAHLVILGDEVEAALRVNGRSAPAISLLDPGDQVQLAGGTVLHVALFHRPGIGPAGEERAGRECPYCRGDLRPEDLVYVCHGCGRAMHFGVPAEGDAPPAEGGEDDGSEEESLRCATLCPSCPVCATPVVLTEGYTVEPGVAR